MMRCPRGESPPPLDPDTGVWGGDNVGKATLASWSSAQWATLAIWFSVQFCLCSLVLYPASLPARLFPDTGPNVQWLQLPDQ